MNRKLVTAAVAIALTALSAGVSRAQVVAMEQVGSGNRANIAQVATNTPAGVVIAQRGNNNFAGDVDTQVNGIYQYNVVQSMETALIQTGDGHVGALTQTNGSEGRPATINQLGREQTATIIQDDFLRSGVAVDQTSGHGGNARLVQRDATDSDAWIREDGVNNYVLVDQGHVDNLLAWVVQAGSDNWADLLQLDAQGMGAVVNQTGSLNNAEVIQTATYYADFNLNQSGSANTARLTQIAGQYIAGRIAQGGNGNVAEIWQHEGSANNAQITQAGNGNSALLFQSANFNDAEIVQTGDLNLAEIRQTGLTDATSATRNSASIRQTGNGFSAFVTQAGTGNLVAISQH